MCMEFIESCMKEFKWYLYFVILIRICVMFIRMFHDLCTIGGKVCSKLIAKSYLLLLGLFVKVFRYFVANDKFFVKRGRGFVAIL